MQRLIQVCRGFIGRISSHKISVYAGQAALFMIISALPLLMLILSLIKFVVPFDESYIMDFGTDYMPDMLMPLFYRLAQELFHGVSVPIISVTSVTVLWAASKGMLSLVHGLDSVYLCDGKRGYIKLRLMALLYTLVFIGVIIATLLFFVAGRYIIKITEINLPFISAIFKAIYSFPVVIYIVVLALIFALLYKILPERKLPFYKHLPGAFAAAVGWVVFTAGYSFYVNRYADYSYIYGSLTAVVLLMLWLYFCMNIFLLGAEVNCLIYERNEKPVEENPV